MRIRNTLLPLQFISLLLFACQPPLTKPASTPYFDVPQYFSEQIQQLYADSLIVIKTSVIHDKADQHQMNWTDWGKEFALFTASDINKPSMIGKYITDTTDVDSMEKVISYTASDASLRTRLLRLTYREDELHELHIVNHESGFLTTTHEELFYLPLNSYVVKSEVKNRFFGGSKFSVLGRIVKKQKHYF